MVFLLLQRLQAITANLTQSMLEWDSITTHTRSMKSLNGSGSQGNLIFVVLQTFLANSQPRKVCPEVSLRPHTAQQSSSPIPLTFRRFLVGRMFLQPRHIKCLILFGQFSFQIIFQIASIFELLELLPISVRLIHSFSHFYATLYALLTVNFPFMVQAHMNESLGNLLLTGMPNTTSASWGRKILLTLATSHTFLSASMSSATSSASA